MPRINVVTLTGATLGRLRALGADDSAGLIRWHNTAVPRADGLFDVPVDAEVAEMLGSRVVAYNVASIDELLNLLLDLAASAGKPRH